MIFKKKWLLPNKYSFDHPIDTTNSNDLSVTIIRCWTDEITF